MSQPVPSQQQLPELPEEYYKPRPQPWYIYDGKNWQEITSDTPTSKPAEEESSPAQSGGAGDQEPKPISKIRILTWNIDALIPFGDPRMSAALKHLESVVSSPPAPFTADTPTIIMLQEMRESDLEMIENTPWIQERFAVSDLDPEHWPESHYGTTTLVDRRLPVSNTFRVRWVSKFGRDGLFVDISVPVSGASTDKTRHTLRLCNSHLESLPSNPPVRPRQVAAASRYLHAPEVHAAVLAGDANAIQPSDRQIATDNNLTDTYLALGGEEDTDEGYTWGYQSAEWMRLRFGCSRMDKVFYCGAVAARQLVKIGVGVAVEEEKVRQKMQDQGLGGWVTDHYGLMAELEILGKGG